MCVYLFASDTVIVLTVLHSSSISVDEHINWVTRTHRHRHAWASCRTTANAPILWQTGLMYKPNASVCLERTFSIEWNNRTQMQYSVCHICYNVDWACMCLRLMIVVCWAESAANNLNENYMCVMRKVAKTRKTPQTMNNLVWLVEQRQRWTRPVVVDGSFVQKHYQFGSDFFFWW